MFRAAKKVFSPFVFFALLSPLFSQVSENGGESVSLLSASEAEEIVSPDSDYQDSEYDDFDSLFENAEDSDEAVVTDEVRAGTDYNVQIGTIKFPIEVSGFLNTEFGGAYVRESMSNDATFYFDFKNFLYFTTRPDKYLALKGVLKTSMPKDENDSESNHLLYLYEMYFDYLMLNRIYITAGKKKSVWGNIRLFSGYYDDSGSLDPKNLISSGDEAGAIDSGDNIDDAQYTNILYDSRDYISGIIKVPFGNHTVTAIAMYDEETSNKQPGTKNMSLAGSAEFIVFGTSINFFGRRFPLVEDEGKDNSKLPIVGLELKRTVFGFDFYGQSMGRVVDGNSAKKIFSSKFQDLSTFDRIISTAGTYRLWSDNAPYVGFNFEFQNIYRPCPDDDEKYFVNRFAFEFGMAKLGPDKNIKIGLQWNHNLTDKTGYIKPGIIFSRILPHCDWRNGIKYEYGKESSSFDKYKLTVGTYLTISMDY